MVFYSKHIKAFDKKIPVSDFRIFPSKHIIDLDTARTKSFFVIPILIKKIY